MAPLEGLVAVDAEGSETVELERGVVIVIDAVKPDHCVALIEEFV